MTYMHRKNWDVVPTYDEQAEYMTREVDILLKQNRIDRTLERPVGWSQYDEYAAIFLHPDNLKGPSHARFGVGKLVKEVPAVAKVLAGYGIEIGLNIDGDYPVVVDGYDVGVFRTFSEAVHYGLATKL